jgi:hypothetical protein
VTEQIALGALLLTVMFRPPRRAVGKRPVSWREVKNAERVWIGSDTVTDAPTEATSVITRQLQEALPSHTVHRYRTPRLNRVRGLVPCVSFIQVPGANVVGAPRHFSHPPPVVKNTSDGVV